MYMQKIKDKTRIMEYYNNKLQTIVKSLYLRISGVQFTMSIYLYTRNSNITIKTNYEFDLKKKLLRIYEIDVRNK